MTRVTSRRVDGVEVDPSGPFCSVTVARTAKRPSAVRLGWARRYRWGIEWFHLAEQQYPGVFDSWVHLRGEGGWTVTPWGAWLAVGRRAKVRKATV